MHWNKDNPVSIKVGIIKNKIITFDAIKFLLKSIKLVLEIKAIIPKIIDMIAHSRMGIIAIINILKIVEDGVNRVNSDDEDNQSNENTVVVPDPKNWRGVKILLTTVGKSIL